MLLRSPLPDGAGTHQDTGLHGNAISSDDAATGCHGDTAASASEPELTSDLQLRALRDTLQQRDDEISTYMYLPTCIHVYIHNYYVVCMYMYMYVCTYIHTCTTYITCVMSLHCWNTYMYVVTHVHVHVHVYTCMYMYIP